MLANVQAADKYRLRPDQLYYKRLDSLERQLKQSGVPNATKINAIINYSVAKLRSFDFTAFKLLKDAENQAIAINRQDLLGHIYLTTSRGYMQKGLLDSCQFYEKKAELIGNKLKHTWIISECELLKAQILYIESKFKEAYEKILPVIKLKEQIKDYPGLANTYVVMAYIYGMSGSFEQTIEYNRKGLAYIYRYGDEIGNCNVYNNMAIVFLNHKDYDSALHYCNKALDNIERVGSYISLLSVAITTAVANQKLGKIKEARRYFNLSYSLADSVNAKLERVDILMNMAMLEYEVGNYAKAIEHTREALPLTREEKTQYFTGQLLMLQAKSLNKMSMYEESYRVLKQYDSIDKAVNNQNQRLNMVEMDKKFQAIQREENLIAERTKREAKERESLFYLILAIAMLVLLALAVYLVIKTNKAQAALKILYNKVEQQNDKLSESNKMKDLLYKILAHDLRTPINGYNLVPAAITEYTQAEKYDELRNVSEDLRSSTEQISSLLDNLLNWSVSGLEPGKGSMQSVEVQELLNEACEGLQKSINSKGLEIKIEVEANLEVKVEKQTFASALRNLLNNAIKYSYPNGKPILFKAYAAGGYAVIALRDYGKGMDDESYERMRQLAEQTNITLMESYKADLSMFLAQQMLQVNSTGVRVFTKPGQGTLFVIKLPI